MEKFFKNFLQEHKAQIFLFSLFRIFSFVQILFWPYAFSKIINIMSQNPDNWREAGLWAGLMILNKITEDFVRLRSKFGLEKIGAKLKISLATFFSEKTEIRKGKKTGEAVQAVKKASEDIKSLVDFYKENILQLPVNLIIIPLILLQASVDYLLLLLVYGIAYLTIDYFAIKLYNRKVKKYFKAAEVFWGTTYRKTPEVWREREDGGVFAERIDQEGKELYKTIVSADNIDNWRWVSLQALSSATIGAAVLFVLYKIVTNTAPVGDLILVTAYLRETQRTLNVITSSLTRLIRTRISLKRLNKAVKIIQ